MVRLHNWEFELQFVGKKCNKISLISDNVVFIANKNIRKEITGCHFKIAIVDLGNGLLQITTTDKTTGASTTFQISNQP